MRGEGGAWRGPVNLGEGVGVVVDLVMLEVRDERDAANADTRPEWHGAVAVLANDIAVDVLRVDVEAIGEEPAEARGVEVGAGADDAVGGQAGELVGDVGERVDGVGDDEQRGVRAVLHELRDDLFEERHVLLHERQPRLALALPRARGDDADVGPGRDGVVRVGHDARAGEERGRVLQVQHLALELLLLHVHERQLVAEVLRQHGLRARHAHVPHPHHRHLVRAPHLVPDARPRQLLEQLARHRLRHMERRPGRMLQPLRPPVEHHLRLRLLLPLHRRHVTLLLLLHSHNHHYFVSPVSPLQKTATTKTSSRSLPFQCEHRSARSSICSFQNLPPTF
jgi:hypothetical protein